MMEKRSESERWGVEVLVDEFPGTPAIICGHSVNAALRRKGPTALHEKGQRSNHKSQITNHTPSPFITGFLPPALLNREGK